MILLTPAADMARRVAEAVERQLAELPRAETARRALNASRLIVTKDLAQCVEISNQYGPEHLIIQTRNARDLVDGITSAGSVFLGDWSPESAGDYASGTNHVLPTYGYTATCSSLGLADFKAYDRAGTVERRVLRAGFNHRNTGRRRAPDRPQKCRYFAC